MDESDAVSTTVRPPTHVVVMGVAGSGKSSVAKGLAARLDYSFLEGDDLHSPANVAKMASGTPLDDADRLPWLRAIAERMCEEPYDRGVVVACSALKRSYRDVLRTVDPATFFVFLDGSADVLRKRVAARHHSFMPSSLEDSQLATLEPLGDDEIGARVDIDHDLDQVIAEALASLRAPGR